MPETSNQQQFAQQASHGWTRQQPPKSPRSYLDKSYMQCVATTGNRGTRKLGSLLVLDSMATCGPTRYAHFDIKISAFLMTHALRGILGDAFSWLPDTRC